MDRDACAAGAAGDAEPNAAAADAARLDRRRTFIPRGAADDAAAARDAAASLELA
jgi:hypothetical protein